MERGDDWIKIIISPPLGYITALVLVFIAPYLLCIEIIEKLTKKRKGNEKNRIYRNRTDDRTQQ